ncbi:MAG: YraN family protein [Bacteroidetes bacterium]|nr:YraN family protein [Bacteroidota bacterium]
MAEHNELVIKGEEIACQFLRKAGYFILDRGWRWQHLELDILAFKDNTLIVVEVKTRSSAIFAQPDDTISNKKLKQVFEAADRYMETKNIPWEVRYDLITVIVHGETHSIEHIEDAFYPFMNI